MYQVLIYLILLQIGLSRSQDTILFRDDGFDMNDPCQEASGTGICVLTENCRVPNNMLRNWKPQICFFHQHENPVICCPAHLVNSTISPKNPTVTPSSVTPGNPVETTLGPDSRLTKLSTIKCKEYMQNYTAKTELVYYGIVLGEDAGIAQFPHMAALGMQDPNGDGLKFTCGGSLISERYILTAAHCFATPDQPTMVRLGERDLSTDADNDVVRDYEIERVIYHPKYKGSSVYNDIALLRLNQTVKFTRYIRPACLYDKVENREFTATATGWGHTQFGGKESAVLQRVALNLFSTEKCTPHFAPARRILQGLQNTQICAGSTTDGRDTCQGDSGGPLVIANYNTQVRSDIFYIVGVTSFGKGCGLQVPAIYTRVASYIDWIEGIAWS